MPSEGVADPRFSVPGAAPLRTNLQEAKQAEWKRPEPRQPTQLVDSKRAQWLASMESDRQQFADGRTRLVENKRKEWDDSVDDTYLRSIL